MTTADRIRATINRRDGVSEEALEPLALAYGLEVEQLNERLSKCVQLLRKGLRSEAIQQANIRPNLFEWAANLDFPEIEDWLEILQFYHIATPQPLNRDAIQQLQEAMVEEQPLEELLRQHRRLAIGRAPLAWRLKVLRAIARLDAMNPVWCEDLEAWEKARLKEIPAELNQAVNNNDFSECSKLAIEITQGQWQVPPPDSLVRSVVAAATKLEFANQTEELSRLSKRVYDAFAEQNEAICRGLKQEWDQVVSGMKASVPKEIFDEAEPAFLWLADLDKSRKQIEEHQVHLSELHRAIDESASLLEIQRAYQIAQVSAESLGESIDTTLQSRYQGIVAELQLAAKRRSLIRIVAIGSAACVIAFAFAWWQWQSHNRQQIVSSVNSLSDLMEAGKLTEAKQYAEKLQTTKPGIATSTEIEALLSDLSGRIEQEAERQASFASYTEEADNSDDLLIDPAALKKAEELARTESEQEQVFRIKRRKEAADRQRQQQQFAELTEEMEQVVRKIDLLEELGVSQLSDSEFDSVESSIDDLYRKYPHVGLQGVNLLDSVKKRVVGLKSSVRQYIVNRQREAKAMNAIRHSKSLASLKNALQSYMDELQDSPVSREFRQVLDESDAWATIEDWNRFVGVVAASDAQAPTPEEAKAFLEGFDALSKRIDVSDVYSDGKVLNSELEAVSKRSDLFDGLIESLNENFISSLLTVEGTILEFGEARVFSFFNSIDPVRNRLTSATEKKLNTLEIVAGSDGVVQRVGFKGEIRLSDQPKQLYEQLLTSMRVQKAELIQGWEREMLLLINQVLQTSGVDHLIKEQLIKQFLFVAIEGSHYLRERLQSSLVLLQQREPAQNLWYRPGQLQDSLDPTLSQRLRAEFSSAYQGASDSLPALKRLQLKQLDWIGTLQRSQDGAMQVDLLDTPSVSGKLFVVRQKAGDSPEFQFERVGTYTELDARVESSSSSGLLAGRPIFFAIDDDR